MVNRSRYDIMGDIVVRCSVPRRKTYIMYGCNLNMVRFQRHVSFMISRGLLVQEGNKWRSTDKGFSYLRDYRRMRKRLEPVQEAR